MRDNVWIFLPLLLYGIAVLLGLCLCYFVAPQNKGKRWIHSQGTRRGSHRILQPERLQSTPLMRRVTHYQKPKG
jgi:hypothetical protein